MLTATRLTRQQCTSVRLRGYATEKRAKDRELFQHKVGSKVHGYTVKEIQHLPERNITAYELSHDKTGARHLHLDCEDTNNVFMATFKTSPTDSTGVAHVLEHTALCGSEKYPIRDPFFNMLKRSVKTYMNAWTGQDFTSYPFGSENVQDFYNLMSVYLDATFHPQLSEWDFKQEGHRLEFSEDGSLEVKGIVYNEMKGAMAESSTLFAHELYEKLFPTITYRHNSGGDPETIRDLTWENLKEFHRVHYHPSNSWTCTYGDMSLEEHLRFINEVLQKFEKIDPKTDIPDEQRFAEHKRFVVKCAPPPLSEEEGKQDKVAVGFLLNKNTDQLTTLSLSLLQTLLMTGPNSPFYQSLIESNLGSNYSPYAGYDSSAREAVFSIGLQGVDAKDTQTIEDLIFKTFEEVAENGFPKERIDAVLHALELSLRHIGNEYGLHLAAGIMHSWIHGGSPIEALSTPALVKEIRKRIDEGPFFQDLVKKYFLENKHRVTLTMVADESYNEEQAKIKADKDAKIFAQLTEADKQKIREDAKVLKARQEEVQDPSILPTITISDISPNTIFTPLEKETIKTNSVQWASQPTNGVIYFKAKLPFDAIPDSEKEELLPYFPLFTQVLSSLGSAESSYREMAQDADLHTGGLSSSYHLTRDHTDRKAHHASLYLASHCLEYNIDKMFSLWSKLLTSPKWDDKDHIKTILLSIESDFQDSLIDSGNVFARYYAASKLSSFGELQENWEGTTQYKFLQRLAKDAEENNLDEHFAILKRISAHMLQREGMSVAVNTESRLFDGTRNRLDSFLNSLNTGSSIKKGKILERGDKVLSSVPKTLIGVPSDVNHCSLCLPSVPYTNPDFVPLQVLAHIMTNAYLHREIREKGGAYGGGASSGTHGCVAFYSYRDPHNLATLEHFENAIKWAAAGEFDEENIKEAKLNVFSEIDHPVVPSKKGMTEFLMGITDEMRQRNRDILFSVNKAQLVTVANKYLKEGLEKSHYSIAILGDNQTKDSLPESWSFLE
eukprot:TRINITY_DN5118_c0_g1_i1.p1 TRINITY_DN5118_c0_g1~~TRINITY_DN5118_c0_g1_i1.p1  ORF type:complete len:1008 (-),score=294.23 TRINITY_DN5118_c0_g1_i1:45-3068(-)